mmetsp:Transcript_29786/g.26347  ORF Transcript_29786/g.26347 Transcript_29786/m.26347 type:complete len:216 (-) Transcript_29786:31-678(-)
MNDYDYDGVLEQSLIESQRVYNRIPSNRNRVGGIDRRREQPRRGNSNDLLSDLPPHMIREMISNPLNDLRGERAQLRVREPRRPQYAPSAPLRGEAFGNRRNIPRRNNRGGARNNQMELDIDNMNYDQLLELENNIGHVSKGYTKQEISSIPVMYSFVELEDSNCPICLDLIEIGTPQLSISCRHQFHIACLKTSLENNKKCPICNKEIISDEIS